MWNRRDNYNRERWWICMRIRFEVARDGIVGQYVEERNWQELP